MERTWGLCNQHAVPETAACPGTKLVSPVLGCVNRTVAWRSRGVIIVSYSFRQHASSTRLLCVQIYSAMGRELFLFRFRRGFVGMQQQPYATLS